MPISDKQQALDNHIKRIKDGMKKADAKARHSRFVKQLDGAGHSDGDGIEKFYNTQVDEMPLNIADLI
ncbi:hypothetical protein BC831DRAFT_553214 [Entophlyctis helioformis]|nr:hypothetical protein BC831DRAFT_553214 [Entophlyctis helioformis]